MASFSNQSEISIKEEAGTTSSYGLALSVMVSLFFVFGIITVFNDVLIPHLKGVFSLSYTEAILVQFCFFSAYLIMSLPCSWLIRKVGYKKSIIVGLLIVSTGCLIFFPASELVWYPLFLFALFVMATGITMLQVAANPYISALGAPEGASSRLNLAGGFNSFATVIGPLVGANFILNTEVKGAEAAKAVQMPYLVLALLVMLIAFIVYRLSLPKLQIESQNTKLTGSVFDFRNLKLGVLAIFLYVGAEVTVGSFMISFLSLDQIAGLKEAAAATYVSMYWGGAMVGRFAGIILLNKLKANKALGIVTAIAFLLILVVIFTTGKVALWSIVLIGLFNSVMWPCIFPLAIAELKEYTSKASGILIMGCVGGAVIPLLQGVVADMIGLQHSFAIALVCYGYLFFYAMEGYKPIRK